MASLLRQLVASPRARHPEARLDLCYVTDNIIVTSGPSSVWPKKAYRNPLDQLVSFLDKKHNEEWSIFEFRAEGTGYPDSEVYNRVHHFPWPDHHPPPFSIVPNLMAAMRNWLLPDGDIAEERKKQRVAVVHCKAGKGRSGTVATSYLISEEGWKREDALQRFTLRRMRSGFGNGVSIPSQLRWVKYVDRWTNQMNKAYEERPVEILEVHVWGLRDGVKVCIEGFIEDGRSIKTLHTFTRDEKQVFAGAVEPASTKTTKQKDPILVDAKSPSPSPPRDDDSNDDDSVAQDVVLRPPQPVFLETSDMNVDFERRNKVKYTGYTMVTSIAHVWFNAWFEGGYEGHDSGIFEIDWEAMDGIKGSPRKGTKSFDRIKVLWKYSDKVQAQPVKEPERGEPVHEPEPSDWKGHDTIVEDGAKHSDGLDSGRAGASLLTMGAMINQGAESLGKELGLRKDHPESADVSRAPSVKHQDGEDDDQTPDMWANKHSQEAAKADEEERLSVKQAYEPGHGKPNSPPSTPTNAAATDHEGVDGKADTAVGRGFESGMAHAAKMISKMGMGESKDHDHHHNNSSPPTHDGIDGEGEKHDGIDSK